MGRLLLTITLLFWPLISVAQATFMTIGNNRDIVWIPSSDFDTGGVALSCVDRRIRVSLTYGGLERWAGRPVIVRWKFDDDWPEDFKSYKITEGSASFINFDVDDGGDFIASASASEKVNIISVIGEKRFLGSFNLLNFPRALQKLPCYSE